MAELVNERLATKADLDLRIAELKTDLIKWMLGIAAGQIILIIALIRLIQPVSG